MEVLLLDDMWFRTSWNYFITQENVFIMQFVVVNSDSIYFVGINPANQQQLVYSTTDADIKHVIKISISINSKELKCSDHIRLMLYNSLSEATPIQDQDKIQEILDAIDVILA